MLVHQSGIEVGIVLFFLSTPSDFGQRTQTGEYLILRKTGRELHQFRPQTCLHADEQLLFFGGELEVLIRVVIVYPVEGDNRRPAMASFSRGVFHVEVEVFTRLHHGGLTFPDGFQPLLLASPCHHRRVRTQSAMVLNVVPTHHHLALLHDDVLHPSHEVSVQFFHVLVAHLLHQCLTLGALRPVVEHHFIATYIDIGRWEEVG